LTGKEGRAKRNSPVRKIKGEYMIASALGVIEELISIQCKMILYEKI
jgi:hypothetical protein